jgi:uncharacterized protein YfiM (DUF2279 family)
VSATLALAALLAAAPLPADTVPGWTPPVPVPLAAHGLEAPAPPAAAAPPRAPDRFFGEDKWTHFFGSFFATSLASGVARAAGLDAETSLLVGAGAATALGAGKELADLRRPSGSASVYDLAWDLAGVGAAAAIVLRTR